MPGDNFCPSSKMLYEEYAKCSVWSVLCIHFFINKSRKYLILALKARFGVSALNKCTLYEPDLIQAYPYVFSTSLLKFTPCPVPSTHMYEILIVL